MCRCFDPRSGCRNIPGLECFASQNVAHVGSRVQVPWLSTYRRDHIQGVGCAESVRLSLGSQLPRYCKGWTFWIWVFPWTTQLARAYKRAVRSAKRNLGPAKQAQPIPLVLPSGFQGTGERVPRYTVVSRQVLPPGVLVVTQGDRSEPC